MKIKRYKKKYLLDILELSKRSDSTSRTASTWHKNMTAVLAYEQETLIGAIPLEKRSISLGSGEYIDILWVTGAHVEPEYRGQGIGMKMDKSIHKLFPSYKGTFVYREDENSLAYKWYKKNGFSKIIPIVSVFKQVPNKAEQCEYVVLKTHEEIKKYGKDIQRCFKKNTIKYGGFPNRNSTFWIDKVETHYYKEFYKYSIVLIYNEKEIEGYALLGNTELRDSIKRFDILEMVTADNKSIKERLYSAIIDLASRENLYEIRAQLSVQDPNLDWLMEKDFKERFRTYILGKLYDPIESLKDKLSETIELENKYCLHIYANETDVIIGNGEKKVTLNIDENILQKMILKRSNVKNIINNSGYKFDKFNEEVFSILSNKFAITKWIYYHIDYI